MDARAGRGPRGRETRREGGMGVCRGHRWLGRARGDCGWNVGRRFGIG